MEVSAIAKIAQVAMMALEILGCVLKVDEKVGYSTEVVFKDLSWPLLCLTVEANSPKNNGNRFNLFFPLKSLKRVVLASLIDK